MILRYFQDGLVNNIEKEFVPTKEENEKQEEKRGKKV
tara:strand:- start:4046 stop:4156 length:111 start_codon:yes stop_codon:yes gene_type:complete